MLGDRFNPGEYRYAKNNELYYVVKYNKGQFIKIIQNIVDKPVSTVDAKVLLLVVQEVSGNRRDSVQQWHCHLSK